MPHLSYNFGRVFTYTLLGAVFGFLSQTTSRFSGFVSWQAAIQALAGVMMLILGLSVCGIWRAPSGLLLPFDRFFLSFADRRLKSQHSSLFSLGLLLGAIPCGLVYAAGLKAAASGRPLAGALLMLAFGLGTVPAMVALGWSSAKLDLRRRTLLYRCSGVLLVILSLVTFAQAVRTWQTPSTLDHHHGSAPGDPHAHHH